MTFFWSKMFYKCTVMTLFRHNTQPKCATITLFPHMPLFRHQRVHSYLWRYLGFIHLLFPNFWKIGKFSIYYPKILKLIFPKLRKLENHVYRILKSNINFNITKQVNNNNYLPIFHFGAHCNTFNHGSFTDLPKLLEKLLIRRELHSVLLFLESFCLSTCNGRQVDSGRSGG